MRASALRSNKGMRGLPAAERKRDRLMKAIAHDDGALSLQSTGEGFGSPGFYFVVHRNDGTAWARYVKGLKEEIRVYPAEADTVRADHRLWLFGKEFLRLHYRMRRINSTANKY